MKFASAIQSTVGLDQGLVNLFNPCPPKFKVHNSKLKVCGLREIFGVAAINQFTNTFFGADIPYEGYKPS